MSVQAWSPSEQVALDEQRAEVARIMRVEIRAHKARRAVQLLVRLFALVSLMFFAGAFAWFVVPAAPVSIPIVIGLGVPVILLFWVTGPAWPKHRRRTPPQ